MKIEYNDLFGASIDSGIESLLSQIKEVHSEMSSMLSDIQSKAKGLGDALSATSSSTKSGRDATQHQAAQVDALYQSYTQLTKAIESLRSTIASLSNVEAENNRIQKLTATTNSQSATSFDKLKAQAELAALALKKVSDNSEEMKVLSQAVKTLEAQVKNMEKAMASGSATTTKAVSSSKAYGKQILSLADSYNTLNPLIEQTGLNLDSLSLSDKAKQQIFKNGEIANASLAGSYNQLYAQYNLIKAALNAMSAEMRNSTAVGKQWEAQALSIMNQMKAMQEATGKHTLSVGDYEKALNGLNLSTQQVLRELPTLANSLQLFFIAISNNVPIFIDNFQRAQKELGGFTKALGATMRVIFSWQTLLLVVLTILPRVAQAIREKKKAQEEANAEAEKALTYEEMMAEALRSREQEIINETNKLKFLTGVLNDHNRSWEERIKAAQIMKREWKDSFDNYTAEDIALGKATESVNKLTEALIIQAEARAYLNKIGELSLNLFDLEDKRDKAKIKNEEDLIRQAVLRTSVEMKRVEIDQRLAAGEDPRGMHEEREALQSLEAQLKRYDNAVDESTAKLTDYNNQIDEVVKTQNELRDRIKMSAFDITDAAGKAASSAAKILEIPSYYYDLLYSAASLTADALDRELVKFDIDFWKSQSERNEQLQELLEARNELRSRIAAEGNEQMRGEYEEELSIVEAEMQRLYDIMENEALEYEIARDAMVAEHADKRLDIKRREIQNEQEAERNARDKIAYEQYEQGMNLLAQQEEMMRNGQKIREEDMVSEVVLKEQLNKALLDSEKAYWTAYLAQLREEGVLTVEAYNEIMSNLVGDTEQKSPTRTSTHKKRGSRDFRNITEVAFAYSSFGETYTDEKGNKMRKIKDEYMDFANAINDALQTSIDYMDEWMDKRIEMAEIAVEKAAEEAEAAKTALDYEQEARANGYANNVELARKEYQDKKRIQMEALAEQKRLQRIQAGIDTAQQVSSLVTATANIWSSYTKLGVLGSPLAIAATALMWGSFAAAKVQAAQLAKAETHGEGMAEYLNYGGSHASGNDIDFGRTKDGRRRRVERGEIVGVINKRNVQKYGVDTVMGIINSLNNGTYEKSPTSLFLASQVQEILNGNGNASTSLKMPSMAMSEVLGADYSSAFDGMKEIADLSVLERGMGELVRQGETRVVHTSEGRIEYKGNHKRIVRNG